MKCILDISLSFYLHHSEARRNRSGTDSGQRSEARRNVAGTSGGQRSEARRNGANNAVGQHCRLESTEERRNGTMRKRATKLKRRGWGGSESLSTPPKGKRRALTPSPSKTSRATSSGTIQPTEATDVSETFESYLDATSSRGEY